MLSRAVLEALLAAASPASMFESSASQTTVRADVKGGAKTSGDFMHFKGIYTLQFDVHQVGRHQDATSDP